MSEENFYRCIPELNKECKKDNCYINGGECENTIYKKYALKGLLEEIERLNNIINELEEYIKPFLYMLNGILDRDIYEQCQLDDFTMIMDKLQELKGVDKE